MAWRWTLALSILSLVGAIPAMPHTATAQPSPAGVPVTVETARRQDVPIIVRGIGTVQAYQSVLIRARVDGTIDRIAFQEGQDVKPGDLLAQIDPRPYQAVFDQAVAKRAADTAMLSNAKRDLGRYTDLARSDFASRQSVDTQTASVSQATANTQSDDAAIAAAKLNLDFTRIVSPVEGRVGLRLVDVGNLVHAADANGIVTVNQIHPISVLFTLPQEQFPVVQDAIRASAGVPLTVLAFSSNDQQQLGEGKLLTIDNSIDPSTGTIKLKAEFANTNDRLWPGEFVNAHLQLSILRNAVTVPSSAVQHGVDGLYVYVVKPDGTAALTPISAGQDDAGVAIVTNGITGNETVVTSGHSRLTAGIRVAASQRSAPAPAAAKTGG